MGRGMSSHLGGVRVVKGGVWELPPKNNSKKALCGNYL